MKEAQQRFAVLASSGEANEAALLYLADIAARDGDTDAAIAGYRRLYDSSVALPARSRAAALLLSRACARESAADLGAGDLARRVSRGADRAAGEEARMGGAVRCRLSAGGALLRRRARLRAPRTHRRRRHTVLASPRFSYDPPLPHSLRKESLSECIVDLVRAGMV